MAEFSRKTTITFGQCDPAGIVYYPNYFDLFNTSTEWMVCEALGVHPRDLCERHGILGLAMVEARNVYHRPSRNGDEVHIHSRIVHVGRSSLRVEHRLVTESGELGVEGFEVRVWTAVDAASAGGMASRPIPQEVRDRLLS